MSTARLFDGTSGQKLITAANAAVQRATPATSMSAVGWLYPTTNTFMAIMNCGFDVGTASWHLLRAVTSSFLSVQLFDSTDAVGGSVVTLTTNTVLPVNAWSFFALRYNGGTKTARLEFNRAHSASLVLTNGLMINVNSGFQLSGQTSGFNQYVGRQTKVGLCQVELSDADLDTLFAGGVPADVPTFASLSAPLKAKFSTYWELSEVANANAVDSTASAVTLADSGGNVGTAAGLGATPVVVGNLTFVSSDPTTGIQFTSAISGGTGTLTSRLYRLDYPLDTPGPSNLVSTQTGSGTLTFTDLAPDDLVYHYTVITTDSLAGTPQTGQSNIVPGSKWKTPVGVVWIGDSITAGGVATGVIATPATGGNLASGASYYLKRMVGPRAMAFNNQAVNGATTGHFAVDAGAYWDSTKDALDTFGATYGWANVVASIMLGTNDGNNPYDPTSLANVRSVANYVTGNGGKVVLHYPPYSAATSEPAFHRQWQPALRTLVNNRSVFLGFAGSYPDTASQYPTIYSDATHLNATGTTLLAAGQAAAIARAIEPGTVAAGGGLRGRLR